MRQIIPFQPLEWQRNTVVEPYSNATGS